MEIFFIGIIIGTVLGLTGSGGALVAIPMFMFFSGFELKEASVLSLVAVAFGSLINLIPIMREAQFRLSLMLFISSILGSYLSIPLKSVMTDLAVALLLAIVSIYGLVMIWKKDANKSQTARDINISMIMFVGTILGVLTTLTGLGGGVFLVPVLTSFFFLSTEKAISTGLLTIFLSASSSFLLQANTMKSFPSVYFLLQVTMGISLSVFILKRLSHFISKENLSLTRKTVYTMVVVFALFKIF